ncbi:MAG: hypothetical protein CO189_07350 [candidate division Zixibacteria bacterium CG_4_9_14_3_um_filter_46_8]|nr:MAG: hypothetical protein CO189_07350 [candidate division Zixibacteria bacterium CG_4_9_14_3_um_filter_46_8]
MGDSGEKRQWLSHSDAKLGRVNLLKSHLEDVANLAFEYASAFGAQEEAKLAGLLHDLGKYGCLFQKRLQGEASI